MGFLDTNSLMTAAGGTATADYVKGVNEANVRSTLQGYSSNLLATIQNIYPNASVQKILGGQQIMPWTNGLSQLSPPFPLDTRAGYPELTWNYQPTNFMATFAISFGGTNVQWYYPQLQGQRLSLTLQSTSGSGKAQLWLDDLLVAQANTTGSSVSVTITITHHYGSWDTVNHVPTGTKYDSSTARNYQCANSSYAILYCFEPDPKYLRERQDRLDSYLQLGYASGSRQVVTETLNPLGLNWMLQTKQVYDIMAQQDGILPEYCDRIGRMAQESGGGYYVDVYLQLVGAFQDGVKDPTDLAYFSQRFNNYFDVSGYIGSSFEHGLIEQLQNSGLTAASTVKILQLANASNQVIYLANSANWTSGATVRNNLINYDTNALGSLISQGYSLLLPTNGAIRLAGTGSWTGQGYVDLLANSSERSQGMIIGRGFSGGYVSDPLSIVNTPFIESIFISSPTYITPAIPVFYSNYILRRPGKHG